jgi:hypothetical protein
MVLSFNPSFGPRLCHGGVGGANRMDRLSAVVMIRADA